MNINLSKYKGEWVLICEKKGQKQIIAHDKDIRKIEDDIKKCKRTPTVLKVPTEDVLTF